MSSCYGKNIQISIFGQSHSPAIGVVIDGLPAGFAPDMEKLSAFLERRAPGRNALSTPRQETDKVEIVSGMADGRFCGAPFAALIYNHNVHSSDYHNIKETPRPGHADFTAFVKYHGAQDVAGGGHFSGRLTAPMCVAGGICLQLLEQEGIYIGAHIQSIHQVPDIPFDPVKVSKETFYSLRTRLLPVMDRKAGEHMENLIEKVQQEGDSVGGVIECAAIGLPVGLGEPIFEGMENRLSSVIVGIPGVKGIEFGNGFACCDRMGSENNDPFTMEEGRVKTRTNRHGGILGGITSGMPLIFRVAVKPTSSIFKSQETVSLSRLESTTLQIQGRHDPCIVPRAVPCIEAATAIAIYDAWLDYKKYQ